MYSLEEIIAMNNKSQQDYQLKKKSKIDAFIAALSPGELQVTMDKVLIRQFEEADKKAHEELPTFIPTYDEICNWHGYGKTKGQGKAIIALEAQAKLHSYLMETCPHCLGDFNDKGRPVTLYPRHACGTCMDEIGRVLRQ